MLYARSILDKAAIKEYCRNPEHAHRFKERIEDGESWERCALSACYSCQMAFMLSAIRHVARARKRGKSRAI